MDKRPWHQHPLPSQKANRSLRLPARVMLRDPEFASFTQVREAYGSFEAGYHLLQTAFLHFGWGFCCPASTPELRAGSFTAHISICGTRKETWRGTT